MNQCAIKNNISLLQVLCLIISCYTDANGLARQQKEENEYFTYILKKS